MKPELQRIAIATACGLADRWVLMKRGLYWRPDAKGYTNDVNDAWILSEAEADKYVYPHDEPVTKHRAPIPDYLNSLDAMAEAEKVLRFDKATMQPGGWVHYIQCLCEVARCRAGVSDDNFKACTFATAAQRAEAFLRTLNLYQPHPESELVEEGIEG